MAEEIVKENQNPKFRLSDTIIVALFPVIAYIIIFTYRAGYFSAFEIPLQFIDFNILDIFIITTLLMGLLAAFISYSNLFYFLYSSNKSLSWTIAKRIRTILPIIILTGAYFVLNPEGLEWKAALIGLTIIILSQYIPALLYRKSKGKYLERMEALDEENRKRDEKAGETIYERVIKAIGFKATTIVIYSIIALTIINYAGRSAAIKQKLFPIVDGDPENVVLYISNNKIIVAPLNRSLKMIEPEFTILNLGDDPDIALKMESIGPLIVNRELLYPTPKVTSTPTYTPTPSMNTTIIPTK